MIAYTKFYRHALAATAFIVALALPSFGQYQPEPAATQPPQAAPEYQPAPAPSPAPELPQALTLPAGTAITVRLTETLSSDQNHAGDQIQAILDQPVVVDGWVAARPGQTVLGRVAVAQKASRGPQGSSQLGVELTDLILVDGQQIPLRTQLVQSSNGGIPGGQQVATVAAPTTMGAIIGAAAGRGPGAAIGAVAGATAGMIGVMLTPGRPTILPAETLLTFRQEYPVTISTVRSAQVFQPVGQQDYAAAVQYQPVAASPAYAAPAPLPYSYYAPSPYPYYSYYPYYYGYPYAYPAYYSPGFGFYYGFGFRPFVGARIAPRVAVVGRGGFRR